MSEYGADAIRYWATGATLGQNLRFNPQEVKMGKKTTIKLWNVARFISMSAGEDMLKLLNEPDVTLESADAWILEQANRAVQAADNAFESYQYARAKDAIDELFWSNLADYYLEFIKYRLFGDDVESRRAAVGTLLRVFLAVLKLYAPIMPFVTEELYQLLYRPSGGSKSVHVSTWPDLFELPEDLDIVDFPQAIAAIDEIRKYKSEQELSLGAELGEYQLETEVDLEKYGSFIQGVGRVKKLS